MTIWILFVCVFVGGPVLYHIGLWLGRSRRGETLMLAFTLGMVLAGVLLQNAGLDQDALMLALGAVAFWLAWIGILVFCALRIRRGLPGHATTRWSRALGAIGTTIPWFGFVWATMVTG